MVWHGWLPTGESKPYIETIYPPGSKTIGASAGLLAVEWILYLLAKWPINTLIHGENNDSSQSKA